MSEERDPQLQALFAAAQSDQDGRVFVQSVLDKVEKNKRLVMLRRACVALLVALIAIPLQDYALALSQVLLVALVEVESALVAQLLAPINSVGGLLSAVILLLRLAHKRLFN